MSTTIRHTHSPGPFVAILALLAFRPVRWLVYAAMIAGAIAWITDDASEIRLTPDRYEFRSVDDPSVDGGRDGVFRNLRLVNRSPYVIQRVRASFRIYDCPDRSTPVSECSKLRVDDRTFVKDVAPGEGADFDFDTYVGGRVSGTLRVTTVVREVVADRDARDDGFVG